jgi:Frag1/DRAM/Sfk1 family
MNVRVVALVAALLPFFAVQLTYLVAASHGLVDWCNPYIDSCTSISATGRKPPASYLFRATMLPSAVVMMGYWWLNYVWIGSLRDRSGSNQWLNSWMLWLGILANVGLIMYVTVLGERGDAWATQRRVGTILFFSFTFLSQLLLLAQLRRLHLERVNVRLLNAMWTVCSALLFLGVLTVVLDAWNEAWYESVEDAFEWVLSLLLQSNFLLGYFVWRQAGWHLEVK